MRGLAVAASFLTRIPMGVGETSARDLARSVPWFPVVGAFIGLAVASVLVVGSWVLDPFVAAAVAVGGSLALTGAFHEDGLADTFDALGGGRSREQALDIMADSRLGTFGTSALVVSLVARIGLFAVLVETEPLVMIPVAHALSRAGVLAVMMVAHPAATGGLGVSYLSELRPYQPLTGIGVAVAGAAIAVGWWTPGVIGAAVISIGVVIWWSMRRIGGITGDVLGACQQVSELAILAVLALGLD